MFAKVAPLAGGVPGGPIYTPCQHLQLFKLDRGAAAYDVLRELLQRGSDTQSQQRCEYPGCQSGLGRLYTCLACGRVGCWGPKSEHARSHAQQGGGHEIAVDVERKVLFCGACGDVIYDPEFDAVVGGGAAETALRESNEGRYDLPAATFPRPLKRRKKVGKQKDWDGGTGQLAPAGERPATPEQKNGFPAGLRGLNNLGNTCFMNSVLQALLHTPPLRNYFLNDRHNRALCQKDGVRNCLGCEMDSMFGAAFSGDRVPFSPADFLYSWWRHAEDLAGYEQQDAHEFFISTVDGIHANAGTMSPMARRSQGHRVGDAECRCIVHKVFSGVLRSDVTCTVCGFTSTTCDPCVDVSLDLEPPTPEPTRDRLSSDSSTGPGPSKRQPDVSKRAPKAGKKGKGRGGKRGKQQQANGHVAAEGVCHVAPDEGESSVALAASDCEGGLGSTSGSTPPKEEQEEASLVGCLERFTRPERLGNNEKFHCQRCQQRQDSTKQMSIRKLPLVLCLHIKRFEHSSSNKTSRKVDRFLKFSSSLDMTPYLSSTIVRLRQRHREVPDLNLAPDVPGAVPSGTVPPGEFRSTAGTDLEPSPCPLYDLFAVVTHSGRLDSGHYIAYLKGEGDWYKCDDACVTKVDEETVKGSQVYLLFYVQRALKYDARGGLPSPAPLPRIEPTVEPLPGFLNDGRSFANGG